MLIYQLKNVAIDTLFLVYAVAGFANLIGAPFIQRLFKRWDYPGQFYRVVGAFELLAAAFLAFPETRFFGLAMAGMVGFFSVVTLLSHRQYGWSVPAMVLFATIVPAAFAAS